MPTLTEALDNLYTTTWQNMKSTVSDNIFDATPFWFWLRANGGMESTEGGRFITEPLRFAKSDNVKWIARGGTVSLADKQFLTVARYDWRYLVDSIVRFMTDDQQNRGRNQILSLMRAKLDNAKDSLVDELEIRLGQVGTGDQMHGIPAIVPNDPTIAGSALGGIDPSVDTWWRNQTRNMTGISFTANGLKEMMNMYNKCANNIRSDAPNIIYTTQAEYEKYWEEIIEQKRIMNKTLGDGGFQAIEFLGVPLIWSPQAPAQRMYFLNTRHLKFRYDPMVFFDMTRWKEIPDQVNDRAAQIITAGNLVTGRRRVHGVMHTMDTA